MTRQFLIACSLAVAISAAPAAQAPDRSKPPASGAAPALKLPGIQKGQLSNGLPVWLVELHEVPVVQVNLLVMGGTADDPAGKFGVASLMSAMLTEGAGSRSSLDIADAIDFLGADLSAAAAVNATSIRLHVPVARVADALPIMADVAQRPTFPAAELERLRQQRLTSLLQARDDPSTTAALAFSRVLYGGDHRFGTATMGTAGTIKGFTVQDLQSFYNATVRPETSTLVVAGDITLDKAMPLLEASFGKWKPASPAPKRPSLTNPGQPVTRVVYLVDKPNAPQSQIRIGWIGVSRDTPDYFPLIVMNTVLGGSFSSRLNLNLREKHGYTYGAFSFQQDNRGAGPFVVGAAVRTDATGPAIEEMLKEVKGMQDAPVTADELSLAKESVSRSLPSLFETSGSTVGTIGNLYLFELPPDYYSGLPARIANLSAADVQGVAKSFLKPDQMKVIAIGDRSVIEPQIDKLNLGTVTYRGADAKPLAVAP